MRHQKLGQVVVVLALLVLCGGCLPAVYTETPRVTGRVVDPAARPVADAEVVVVPGGRREPLRSTSRKDGRFEQAAATRWAMIPLIFPNLAGPSFKCHASHEGQLSGAKFVRQNETQVRFFGIGRAESVDVGDLVVPPAVAR